jgi:hypothetical protein
MTETDRDTVQLNAEQLAKHALIQAYESPDEYRYGTIPDDLDVSLYDAHTHITEVDEITTDSRHGPPFPGADDKERDGLRVHAELTGYESERVARGTRYQPPEYKQHEVTVHVTGWWFPHPDQLAPLTAIEVECEGGIPSPPDPEPYEDRL